MIALGTAALQSTEPSRGVSIGLWVAFGLAVLWLVVSIAEHWRHRRHVALAEKGEALAKRLTTFAGARRNYTLGFLAGPSPIEDTAHQVRVLASRIRRGRRPKWRQRRKG